MKGFRAKLERLRGKPQDTYDLETGKSMTCKYKGTKAYQVAFQQTSDTYTDDEYDSKVREIAKRTKSKVYGGNYGKTPETSFYCKNKAEALKIAKEFNQCAVWDWENMKEIENPFYDESKGNKIGG